jgi:Na+-transporting NADH:ubiquinone oxidoreductase subunit NqrC
MSPSAFRPSPAATAIHVVRLCAACAVRYATAALCDTCLRESEADIDRKRAILLPADFPDFA